MSNNSKERFQLFANGQTKVLRSVAWTHCPLGGVDGDCIPSIGSTISATVDSASGELIYCGVEKSVDRMANQIIEICVDNLWGGELIPSFAPEGRKLSLHWAS
jgi:hypothetical protein